MVDKLDFAKFIKEKRAAKHLTQEQLADLLFISKTAVSKWERGVTYPDITLISRICEVLGISEHEFITACDDTEVRRQARDAEKYRTLSKAAFWTVQAAFAIPVLTCFIVNLATAHTLSWFFIVLLSLSCGYSILCLPFLLKKNKALLSLGAATASVALLLVSAKLFGGTAFSLWKGELIFLFCACLPWGVWAAFRFTRQGWPLSLILLGAFCASITHMLDFILQTNSNESVPFLNEGIGLAIALAGGIVWAVRYKKRGG